MTYGGYSTAIVVNEKFVLRVPANLDLAEAAPLLCAGITVRGGGGGIGISGEPLCMLGVRGDGHGL